MGCLGLGAWDLKDPLGRATLTVLTMCRPPPVVVARPQPHRPVDAPVRCRRLAGERPRDPHRSPDFIRILSPLIDRLSSSVFSVGGRFSGDPVDVCVRSASLRRAPRARHLFGRTSHRGRAGRPDVMSTPRFDHLRALEAESIHILREVVAEFERPVMLYSIGKDSSVLLRLAQKAFYPGPIPFPLLHIDTGYKFREMITFRDWYAAEIGARLIVHTNQEALDAGTQPFALGTQRCCSLLKTTVAARRPAGRQVRRGVRRRAPRRGEIAGQGARLLAAQRQGPVGSQAAASRAVAPAEQPARPGRERARLSAVELDRARRLALHPRREHSGRAALLRPRARGHRARQLADRPRAVVRAAAARRAAADRHVPHAFARMFAVHGRGPLHRRHDPEDHRGAGRRPSTPSASCASSTTIRTRSMEMKKREGYF